MSDAPINVAVLILSITGASLLNAGVLVTGRAARSPVRRFLGAPLLFAGAWCFSTAEKIVYR